MERSGAEESKYLNGYGLNGARLLDNSMVDIYNKRDQGEILYLLSERVVLSKPEVAVSYPDDEDFIIERYNFSVTINPPRDVNLVEADYEVMEHLSKKFIVFSVNNFPQVGKLEYGIWDVLCAFKYRY